MKALICTRCNSNELVRQGDIYVCPFCGTQYTDDEIKKMQIEGTVKIDNSDMIERFLQNARRAKSKEDWEETEKYYNMVEQYDPSNIEAIFYSSYGKAKESLVVNEKFKREAVFKTLTKCVSILDDNYDINKEAELRPILEQISADVIGMYSSNFVYTQSKNGYGVTSDDRKDTYMLFNTLNKEFEDTICNIIKKFPDNKKLEVKYLYDMAIKHAEVLSIRTYTFDTKQSWRNEIIRLLEELNQFAKSAEIAQRIEAMKNESNKKKNNNIAKVIIISILGIAAACVIGWFVGTQIGGSIANFM